MSTRNTLTRRAAASAVVLGVLGVLGVEACSTSGESDGKEGARNAQLPTDPGGESGPVSSSDTARGDGGLVVPIDVSTGCKVDDDCLRIEKGCCHLGQYIGVTKSKAAAYQQGLHCERVSCPMIVVEDDHSVAQCNTQTQTCEIVLPADIACNGFTTNPHACPKGWKCKREGRIADIPGKCVEMCGGFAGIQCSTSGTSCVDDPDDDCDPNKGGRDCGGICTTATD